MAAIRTMKRFDKQKEPAALSFSKAAGSKWARGYVCYSRQKNLCIVRLCNIIICADVQAHQLVKIAVSAGKYNDRKIRFLPDFSAYLETILIGQIDV